MISRNNRYHKIRSVFKRSDETHKLILGAYSLAEYKYLENNQWEWT